MPEQIDVSVGDWLNDRREHLSSLVASARPMKPSGSGKRGHLRLVGDPGGDAVQAAASGGPAEQQQQQQSQLLRRLQMWLRAVVD
mmetsp:Transcript_71305/g.195417  ORF Transcript_71305/g.195417 Transcript_71305/m.195417 type:complete len:85 (-) Transcript_71305:614-868(-)